MVFSNSRENDDLHDDDHGGLLLFPSSPRSSAFTLNWRRLLLCSLSTLNKTPQCLKITEKVAFNIASEASYVYVLSAQKNHQKSQKWSILASFWNLNDETFLVIFKHCVALQSLITLAFKESLLMMSFAMNFSPILELDSHYIFKVYRIFSAICQVKIL